MEFVKIEDLISYQIKGLWGEEFDDSFHCTPVIKTNNMNYDGTIDLDNLTYRNIKHDSILENYLQKGDLLIEKSGGTKTHSVGYVTYFDGEEKKYVCNNFILGLRPDTTKINSKYLFYNLKYMYENGDFSDCYNKTTGIQNLKVKFYLAKKIKLIELSKQSEIIEVLDSITKQISSFKSLLENLDNIVKSQFIEMFGDPKVNPNGYEIKKISDIFNVGSSKRVFESEWTDSGVPFYRAREIVKLSKDGYVDNELYITEEMYDNYKKKYGVPQEDDMMVTGVGTLGICYIVKKEDKFYFKDGNTLWFKNKGLCNVRFIRDQYNTDFVREQIEANANASTVGTYTITNANNTRVLVPPIDLQNEYVSFCEVIDKSKLNKVVSHLMRHT